MDAKFSEKEQEIFQNLIKFSTNNNNRVMCTSQYYAAQTLNAAGAIYRLPDDAYKIIIHNARNFEIWGSNNGAYKVEYGRSIAEQIPGISGHVTSGQVTDAFFKGIYNIYMEKSIDNNRREFYALKDGQRVAYKLNGLPDDPRLLAIHNLAGVIYFGSGDGAYKLKQGELIAHRVPGTAGPVRQIILGGSAREDDAYFLPE
ncbi:hypothetical protein Bhyg_11760 [Pseudolycoriella hygida]|uniref:Uncharacterized protein n=1 Tax=Pseudolycoriella hygida TaxID=35572 RepID=A0A9Q0MW49_9DIPT|nr:hypothetical protein Bhyg_11760 [Pseudolycoriella hygida]